MLVIAHEIGHNFGEFRAPFRLVAWINMLSLLHQRSLALDFELQFTVNDRNAA
jgi:hypothetical protein